MLNSASSNVHDFSFARFFRSSRPPIWYSNGVPSLPTQTSRYISVLNLVPAAPFQSTLSLSGVSLFSSLFPVAPTDTSLTFTFTQAAFSRRMHSWLLGVHVAVLFSAVENDFTLHSPRCTTRGNTWLLIVLRLRD